MAGLHLRRTLPVLLLSFLLGATLVRPAHAVAPVAVPSDHGALSWLWDLVTHLLPLAGPQIDPDGNR
jgi:hypothetical protein